MKKTFLFLGLALLIGVLCSCGGNANTNSGEQSPDSEMYDSGDGPSEEEYEYAQAQASKGNNFKAIAYSEKERTSYLAFTTENRTEYYLFDNEVDYAELLLQTYVWQCAYIALDDEEAGKYGHLIWSIPYAEQLKSNARLKDAFLKPYYNSKNGKYATTKRKYGYQEFKFQDLYFAFFELSSASREYIRKDGDVGKRAYQRISEWGIPDGSIIVQLKAPYDFGAFMRSLTNSK